MTPNVEAIRAEQTRLFWEFCKLQFPEHTYKRVAATLDCSTDVLEKIATGKRLVSADLITKATLVWRKRFVAWIHQPYGDWTAQWRLDAEIEAVGDRLDRIRSEYERLRMAP